MKPLGQLVLVKPSKKEMERNGITLTASNVHQPEYGVIKEVGDDMPKHDNGDATVKIEDKVLFRKDAFTKVVIDDAEYLLIDIKNIYAVV